MVIMMLYPEEKIVNAEAVLRMANEHRESEALRETSNPDATFRPLTDAVEAMEYCEDEGIATFRGGFVDCDTLTLREPSGDRQ